MLYTYYIHNIYILTNVNVEYYELSPVTWSNYWTFLFFFVDSKLKGVNTRIDFFIKAFISTYSFVFARMSIVTQRRRTLVFCTTGKWGLKETEIKRARLIDWLISFFISSFKCYLRKATRYIDVSMHYSHRPCLCQSWDRDRIAGVLTPTSFWFYFLSRYRFFPPSYSIF